MELAATQKEELKIILGGQQAGFCVYEAKPAGPGNSDGSFESTTNGNARGLNYDSLPRRG
jgi:hypothetical protein